MDKYKINYIYSDDNNIDDIFVKVLSKELKKYLMTYKDKKIEKMSSCTCLTLEERKEFK